MHVTLGPWAFTTTHHIKQDCKNLLLYLQTYLTYLTEKVVSTYTYVCTICTHAETLFFEPYSLKLRCTTSPSSPNLDLQEAEGPRHSQAQDESPSHFRMRRRDLVGAPIHCRCPDHRLKYRHRFLRHGQGSSSYPGCLCQGPAPASNDAGCMNLKTHRP